MKNHTLGEAISKVLVIDDEESIRDGCHQIIERDGHHVVSTASARKGLEMALADNYDVILLDIRMPGLNGIEILKRIKGAHHLDARVIIITAYGSIQLAVEAMRYGAHNVLTKPFSAEELVEAVQEALTRGTHPVDDEIPRLIGVSDYTTDLKETIKRVARTDSTVLITGESGTGKELVAIAIQELGKRREMPFVSVDCSSLVENLMESELFGHVQGAFSGATKSRKGRFQMAHKGTLFLDEISNISMATQAKLLRVIQEQDVPVVGSSVPDKVDVRLIAATNRNLKTEIEKGRFREDLFYRISVVPIQIKPLREHKRDVVPIAMHYLSIFKKKHDSRVQELSEEAKKSLTSYNWPGNIRELKNTIERLCVLCNREVVGLSDILYCGQDGFIKAPVVDPFSGTMTLVDVERDHIQKALRHFGFQINKTAQFLGIDRKTLRLKIRSYNIDME